MAIHLGKPVSDAYLGDSKINEMYLGAEKIYIRNTPIPDTVTIGDYTYNVVKIGKLAWITENLRLYISGSIWYKNNPDNAIYGRYYTKNMLNAISEQLPNGWKLPSKDDFNYLRDIAGSTAEERIIATFAEGYYESTNQLGLSLLPSARRQNSSSIGWDNLTWCYLWGAYEYDEQDVSDDWKSRYTTLDAGITTRYGTSFTVSSYGNPDYWVPVRICKTI